LSSPDEHETEAGGSDAEGDHAANALVVPVTTGHAP
jgi:hypothetical protein